MAELTPPYQALRQHVRLALEEDIGSGDVTAQLINATETAQATVICREHAVICGRPWFDEVFAQLDKRVRVDWRIEEGQKVQAGQTLCTLQGPARSLLSGERTALNFLQTLSGTASEAHRYVDAIAGTGTRILDTRKTIPGLRLAQKYAVRCGGGLNHRIGLYDMILIKENHILAAGSITQATIHAKQQAPGIPVEVEVENLEQLQEALEAQVDRILLDNMDTNTLRQAVAMTDGKTALEASGGVDLESIRNIAETGVDYISVGAITKHLRAIDLSMRFK